MHQKIQLYKFSDYLREFYTFYSMNIRILQLNTSFRQLICSEKHN